MFEVTNADFQKYSSKIFGYDYTHEKLKGLRDLFENVKTLYAYKLNSSAVKATNIYGTAKCGGIRGNDMRVIIQKNVDDETLFDVELYFENTRIDHQTVASGNELKDNDFVIWRKETVLAVTASTPFLAGTNGTVDGTSHQTYLDKIESYSFNVLGVVTTESTIKKLYANFTERMRDEVGVKFQTVIHNEAADYEGVVNVKNDVTDADVSVASLVYWVTGAEAGCKVNESCLNWKYNGEFSVNADYTQAQLTKATNDGEFTFHMVNGDVRVLSDINSLTTTSDTKGDIFKKNQTIRVIDQVANDIATQFNTKYLGAVLNDASGRTSFWADIVKHHEQLQELRAIENFNDADVVVEQGDAKDAVAVSDAITVVNSMEKLYMSVVVA